MIDGVFWIEGICDLCQKDTTAIEPLLEDYYTQPTKIKEIYEKWYKDITCPCIIFYADMDQVVICEKHLKEIMDKKDEFLKKPSKED